MFFNSWTDIGRVLLIGVLAYSGLIILLRVTGKRTLSKLNAFDFVVTVALGSTLATVLLSKDVALLEGLTAFAVLIALQFLITWLSVRSSRVSSLVKGDPALVFYQGRFLRDAMRRERVVEPEILSAIRNQGIASIDDVAAVVLETQGDFTVLTRADFTGDSSLRNVLPPPADA